MMSQNRQVERDREAVRGLHAKLDSMGQEAYHGSRMAIAMAALDQIASRSDSEMEGARTLHYDMRGWALEAIRRIEGKL